MATPNRTIMKAVKLTSLNHKLEVQEVPVPKPLKGEVLIEVHASPINPADWLTYKGHYPVPTTLPLTMGLEASGIVVEVGEGVDKALVGKKVAMASKRCGMWAEFVVANAAMIFPIEDNDMDRASSSFVNPVTVAAMLDLVQAEKYKAVVNTAGGSHLGKIMLKHFSEHKIHVIAIVRNKDKAEILKREYADEYCHILSTDAPNFKDELTMLAQKLEAKCFFEAVCGKNTAEVLSCLPKWSKAYIYGLLQGENLKDISLRDITFEGKEIHGFWLNDYLEKHPLFAAKMLLHIQLRHKAPYPVLGEFNLDHVNDAIKLYEKGGEGKVLIKPHKK